MSRKTKRKRARKNRGETQSASSLSPRATTRPTRWFDPRDSRERVANALRRAGPRPHLVGFEAVGIQEFIAANGRPLAMEGASRLIKQFDRYNLERHCTVFAGGGRGLQLVDETRVDAVIAGLRTRYRDATENGQLAIARVPFDIHNQRASLRWLRLKLDGAKDAAEMPAVPLPNGPSQPCSDCKVRAQATHYRSAEGPVASCARCAKVVEAGRDDSSARWTFEAISNGGPIAIVSADGNNLGALFAELTSLEEHAICSDVVAAIFARAHATARPTGAPFVAPVVGGDDIRVILPPEQLFPYVTTLAREVEACCSEVAGSGLSPAAEHAISQIGVGVGAVIAPFHYPAHRLVSMAHDFEDSAKQACLIHDYRSAFDFVWLKSGEELSEGMRALDRAPAIELSEAGIADYLARARALRDLPTSQRALIAGARVELCEEEFMNSCCYQVARSAPWRRWFETCNVDWRDRRALAANLPDARLLDVAQLLGASQ